MTYEAVSAGCPHSSAASNSWAHEILQLQPPNSWTIGMSPCLTPIETLKAVMLSCKQLVRGDTEAEKPTSVASCMLPKFRTQVYSFLKLCWE